MYTKTKAVIIAVSREKGIELVKVFEKSINKQKFKMTISFKNFYIIFSLQQIASGIIALLFFLNGE